MNRSRPTNYREYIAVLFLSILTFGCGGGGGSGSNGVEIASGSTAGKSVGSGSNSAPTIVGNPTTSVAPDNSYEFIPSASDADLDPLNFSIVNQPDWAIFDPTTGSLTGTPGASDIGVFGGVTISVNDGQQIVSLSQFSITVEGNSSNSGSATLSWSPPTTNEDGSVLTDLAGFRIYYGTSQEADCRDSANVEVIDNPGASSAVIAELPSGTWYFAGTAFDTSGNESSCSNEASKTF